MGLKNFANKIQANADKRLMKTQRGRQLLDNRKSNSQSAVSNPKPKEKHMNNKSNKIGFFRRHKISDSKSTFDIYKKKLHKHDGYTHVLELWAVEQIINSSSLHIGEDYTDRLNAFLDSMRSNGYKIVNISTTTRPFINSQTTKLANGATVYNTEIQYK